ncbi:MAG: 50S ribosomal protein L29 [Patescibacteria group bacterium]
MKFKDKMDKDLIKLLGEKRDALSSFRFGISGSKARNIMEGRNIRKEIASILTEISSRKRTSKKNN